MNPEDDTLNFNFFFLYTLGIVVTDIQDDYINHKIVVYANTPVEYRIQDKSLPNSILTFNKSPLPNVRFPKEITLENMKRLATSFIYDYLGAPYIPDNPLSDLLSRLVSSTVDIRWNECDPVMDDYTLMIRIADSTQYIARCNYEYIQHGRKIWEE